jgi:hypothetical protein
MVFLAVMILPMFFYTLHLTIVVEVSNGTKGKTISEPAFKSAKFWSNENHWEWATKT